LELTEVENMRIIAELPHPDCKISIFNMNQKYIVKFEQGTLEQSYKLSELDLTGGGVNEIFQILDEAFIATVVERFKIMRTDFAEAYNRQQY
jgi:predicted nucleic-acid-binding Zn-ribbon protein